MRNWFRANRWGVKQKSVHDLSLFSLRYWSSTDFPLNWINEQLQVNFIFKNNFQCAVNGFPFPDLKGKIKTQIIHFALRSFKLDLSDFIVLIASFMPPWVANFPFSGGSEMNYWIDDFYCYVEIDCISLSVLLT